MLHLEREFSHIDLTLGDSLASTSPLSSIEFYDLSTSVINKGYKFLDNSLSSSLKKLFDNRVQNANRQLIFSLGFSAALFLIVLYFLIGLFLSTIRSINSLTQTTRKFYKGDLDARVMLSTNDELNNIAIGFNEMAVAFQTLMSDKEEISTRLRAIIDNSPIGIWFSGKDGRYYFVNKTFCNLVGKEEKEFIDTHSADIAELFGEEIAQHCISSDRAALEQDVPHISYETIPCLNAKPRLLEITKVKLKNAQGDVIGLIGISQDITDKRQQEEDLQLADMVYKNSSEAMMITNHKNEIIAINPALSSVTGYSKDELLGKDPKIFASGKQSKQFYLSMWEEIRLTGKWQGEIWNTKKNGTTYPEWLSINTIYDDYGDVFRRISLFSDISEQKKAEELILRQANYDSLTNLPNRRMFHNLLEQEIKKSHREKRAFALIFLDLDDFKSINDSKGHEYGDELLVEAGKRITNCVRESDTIARIGGDEFTIILPGLPELYYVETVCQKILEALSKPFEIAGTHVYLSASLGVTLKFPQ